MIILLFFFLCISQIQTEFTSVRGFSDLDDFATPAGFGLLLVLGEDSIDNQAMAEQILNSLDSLPEYASVDLWCIAPDAPGYVEIADLSGYYNGYPSTVILVGHCGFLELDPQYLISEIVDSWFTWGDPDSRITGICNFCRRCNP
jgi:hypothetical protein